MFIYWYCYTTGSCLDGTTAPMALTYTKYVSLCCLDLAIDPTVGFIFSILMLMMLALCCSCCTPNNTSNYYHREVKCWFRKTDSKSCPYWWNSRRCGRSSPSDCHNPNFCDQSSATRKVVSLVFWILCKIFNEVIAKIVSFPTANFTNPKPCWTAGIIYKVFARTAACKTIQISWNGMNE